MFSPISRFKVSDLSMSPTLKDGDYVLTSQIPYKIRGPNVNDIVVIKIDNKYLIKRIARILNNGSYFVLGDNQKASKDSRHFGPIKREQIVGKVILTIK